MERLTEDIAKRLETIAGVEEVRIIVLPGDDVYGSIIAFLFEGMGHSMMIVKPEPTPAFMLV